MIAPWKYLECNGIRVLVLGENISTTGPGLHWPVLSRASLGGGVCVSGRRGSRSDRRAGRRSLLAVLQMLTYQRKFFTDREQRLCLGKDRGVPQEPMLVVCTVVLDHVQRKVQYSTLGTLPQLIDTLNLFVGIHPKRPLPDCSYRPLENPSVSDQR